MRTILALLLAAVPCGRAVEKVVFADRCETFTNAWLIQADSAGLMWGTQRDRPAGLVKWEAMPDAEIQRMGLPARFKQEITDKAQRARQAAEEARVAAENRARLEKLRAADAEIEAGLKKIFTKLDWSRVELIASVDLPFYSLPFDQKKAATQVALQFAQRRAPGLVAVDLRDALTGKSVGSLGVFGFKMK